VPGNVPGGKSASLLLGRGGFGLRRLFGGDFRLFGRRGLRQDFGKEFVARAGLLFGRDLRVTIRVLAVTRPADDFDDFGPHQARHMVVQEETAARTIIINQVA